MSLYDDIKQVQTRSAEQMVVDNLRKLGMDMGLEKPIEFNPVLVVSCGKGLTRKQAIEIARQTLEQAESERLPERCVGTDKLHAEIINIQVDSNKIKQAYYQHAANRVCDIRTLVEIIYKTAHRDARHAAAEIVLNGG